MKKFLEFILERSKNDPISEVYNNKKTAFFVIGAPASGKNYFTEKEILRKNRHFKVIDPDQSSDLLTRHLNKVKTSFKTRLEYSEYVNILKNRIETYPRIEDLNIEIEKQFEILLHEETNIVYNSTGNNIDLLTYLVNKCNEFNYTVVFLHVMGKNLDWQINMSNQRAAKTGRPVDKEYLIDLYKKSPKLIKYYSNLDIYNYYLIWNRGVDEKPKWYRYENGKLMKRSSGGYKLLKESNQTQTKVLHAFDMDDTLIESPLYTDFIKNGIPSEKTEVGKVIRNFLSSYGLSVDDIKIENGRITTDPFKSPPEWKLNKNGRSIVPKPDEYYKTKESLGNTINGQIKKIFDYSEDQVIITGRSEMLRGFIEKQLYKMDIYPNKGVYMCPNNIKGSDNIANWKANVIGNLLDKYDEVHFYEDKKTWADKVRQKNPSNRLKVYLINNGKIIKKY